MANRPGKRERAKAKAKREARVKAAEALAPVTVYAKRAGMFVAAKASHDASAGLKLATHAMGFHAPQRRTMAIPKAFTR